MDPVASGSILSIGSAWSGQSPRRCFEPWKAEPSGTPVGSSPSFGGRTGWAAWSTC
jgi:hypothetical protein